MCLYVCVCVCVTLSESVQRCVCLYACLCMCGVSENVHTCAFLCV